MITISLCMIVKNEENTLSRCLDSVKDIVDEIIIVDTGSTDSTKKIARKYTDKIYDFEWIEDFSAARNFSFSKANKDYILWLDADDVILEEDRKKLKITKKTLDSSVDTVLMKYNVGFDDKGNVTFSFFRERLVKRTKNFKWVDPIHEYIDVKGNVIIYDIAITHTKNHFDSTDRNINIFLKMIEEGKEFSPRNLFYFAKTLYNKNKINDAITYLNKFLDTDEGWVEDKLSACFILSLCYDQIDDRKNMLTSLFKSFEYDLPRAEICCLLGYYYTIIKDYRKAIFWYEIVTKLDKPDINLGFTYDDCWDYIPYIQLCICHDKIGNTEKAIMYNNMVLKIRPNDSQALCKKKYYDSFSR